MNNIDLEIKQIDLSLSEEVKAYYDWYNYWLETYLSLCGLPNERNNRETK